MQRIFNLALSSVLIVGLPVLTSGMQQPANLLMSLTVEIEQSEQLRPASNLAPNRKQRRIDATKMV